MHLISVHHFFLPCHVPFPNLTLPVFLFTFSFSNIFNYCHLSTFLLQSSPKAMHLTFSYSFSSSLHITCNPHIIKLPLLFSNTHPSPHLCTFLWPSPHLSTALPPPLLPCLSLVTCFFFLYHASLSSLCQLSSLVPFPFFPSVQLPYVIPTPSSPLLTPNSSRPCRTFLLLIPVSSPYIFSFSPPQN